ncbi:MAG: hypothetical protein QOJ44_2132 [Acidimicrobiaceae bacterium]|jgi:hypothetical protein|nr:hypothetical protein [Acidimicrobiaceae bacterium]
MPDVPRCTATSPIGRRSSGATGEDSICSVQRSLSEAALDQGSPVDAMRRAVATMVAVGDRLMFLFGDPGALEAFGAMGAAMRVRPRALSLRQWAQSAKTGAALKISAGLA